MMIKKITIGLSLIVSIGLIACSRDNGNTDNSDTNYRLSFRGEDNAPRFEWQNNLAICYLRLDFGKDIPKGSEWYLDVDEPWVKVRNTYGKVNGNYEHIPLTIEDNTNYTDRVAHIYLNVQNGLPYSSDFTTVTILQYGYETYFDCGAELSFDTDRSQAIDNLLKLNMTYIDNIVEVDWGDGIIEVFNKYDSIRLISHNYSSSTKTYHVKLRFGSDISSGSAICRFSFNINSGQGITAFYNRQGDKIASYNNHTDKIYVNFKNGDYSFR